MIEITSRWKTSYSVSFNIETYNIKNCRKIISDKLQKINNSGIFIYPSTVVFLFSDLSDFSMKVRVIPAMLRKDEAIEFAGYRQYYACDLL